MTVRTEEIKRVYSYNDEEFNDCYNWTKINEKEAEISLNEKIEKKNNEIRKYHSENLEEYKREFKRYKLMLLFDNRVDKNEANFTKYINKREKKFDKFVDENKDTTFDKEFYQLMDNFEIEFEDSHGKFSG